MHLCFILFPSFIYLFIFIGNWSNPLKKKRISLAFIGEEKRKRCHLTRQTNYIVVLESQTKNEQVQAFVGQVFIDEHLFSATNATSKKLYEISVLKFCNGFNFIFELL